MYQADAVSGDNPIPNPEIYTNVTNPQQIFMRFSLEVDPLCVRVESFMLGVEAFVMI